MALSPTSTAYFQFHVALLLWGFTAILGDIISLSALVLVWWRVGMSGAMLGLVPHTVSEVWRMTSSVRKSYLIAGLLVALHWLCFYGSIKLANASVAVLTLSTSAVFTVIFEALVFKHRINRTDILFGGLVIPIMWLITSGLPSGLFWGLVVGLLSAMLLSAFTIVNKLYVHDAHPRAITFLEMVVSWVFLGAVAGAVQVFDGGMQWLPTGLDWAWLLVLSLCCTVIPFILSLMALRFLSAFTANFLFNLEPVYGILLAAVILKDYKELSQGFYLGAGLLLVLVLFYSWPKARAKS